MVVTMCAFTAIRPVTEVLVRYEDSTVFVAYELACGCVKLRPATLADLEKGMPLLEGSADTDASDEPAIPALALAA